MGKNKQVFARNAYYAKTIASTTNDTVLYSFHSTEKNKTGTKFVTPYHNPKLQNTIHFSPHNFSAALFKNQKFEQNPGLYETMNKNSFALFEPDETEQYGYESVTRYRPLTRHELAAITMMGFLILIPCIAIGVGRKLAIWRNKRRRSMGVPYSLDLPRWCSTNSLHKRNRISLLESVKRLSQVGGSNRNLLPLLYSNNGEYGKLVIRSCEKLLFLNLTFKTSTFLYECDLPSLGQSDVQIELFGGGRMQIPRNRDTLETVSIL